MINKYPFLKEEYNNLGSKSAQVFEIFKHYFKEDRVELIESSSMTESRFLQFMSQNLNTFVSNFGYTDVRHFYDYHNYSRSEFLRITKDIPNNELNLLNEDIFKEVYPKIRDKFIRKYVLDGSGRSQITVYYPEVEIENEHGRKHTIKDVFLRTIVNANGSMGGVFSMVRSTLTPAEAMVGYEHSHKMRLGRNSYSISTPSFNNMCTGEGPINRTMSFLNREFSEEKWMLYCYELDKYIHTESISGGPYIRMEQINSNNGNRNTSITTTDFSNGNNNAGINNDSSKLLVMEFIEYLIKEDNPINITYSNNEYTLGMSYLDYNLTLSNLFIKWYNKKLEEKPLLGLNDLIRYGVLVKALVANNSIIQKRQGSSNEDMIRGFTRVNERRNRVITFKGKVFNFKIEDEFLNSNSENESILLNPALTGVILKTILEHININYGKSNIKGGFQTL